ncbi:conserved protein of unknown function [Tenacibaculum sp. 190130A14a]|uniref:Uncharacterized protein n=1 Tax=Tenacibaculum polynesiense TaxID=3137857 RepID=A0ABP1F716_9FLAO
MDKKKEIERHQLIKFISNSELKLRVSNIIDFETPDFILDIDGLKVSLEHTRLINPKLKQLESYREKIINNALKLFREKYDDELYVLMTFNNIKLKSGLKAEMEYSIEVFKLVETIYLNNKNFEFDISSKFLDSKVSNLIDSFSISNTRKFENWQHFGAYLVERVNIEWLQTIISKKEKNIKKYPEEYDENWLLLVSDFGTKASTHDFEHSDFDKLESNFDRVYIYNYMPDAYMRIA